MNRTEILRALREHAPELRACGVAGASLFGSVARGEASAQDIDIAVRLDTHFSAPGLDYIGRLDQLQARLSALLGCKVDVVEEPVRKPRLQSEIDRDRALVF